MHTAMILAAGRGERLKPLTDTIPKALCPIGGIPIIEYHIHQLAKAGFERVVINHAYLGGEIRRQLGHGGRWGLTIEYAPEPPGGLETGGGIVNALPLLGKEAFLTVNADIYTDYPFIRLKAPTQFIHLVLVPPPANREKGDFGLSPDLWVTNEPKKSVFSGIAVYHPRVFQEAQPGRYSVTPMIRRLVADNLVSGEYYTGTWFDVGSPQQLAYVQALVKQESGN